MITREDTNENFPVNLEGPRNTDLKETVALKGIKITDLYGTKELTELKKGLLAICNIFGD